MSAFSDKCKEYMKSAGITTYQLSASSGLNRTSLQRMVTGKRLPELSFVQKFCDFVRINPSEKEDLIKLYETEKLGKDVYESRCYIQKFLDYLSSHDFSVSEGFRLPCSKYFFPLSFYENGNSFYAEREVYSYLEDFLVTNTSGSVYLNLPPQNDLLLHTLTSLYNTYKALPSIIHIFPIYRNNEIELTCFKNLKSFVCSLLLALSGFRSYAPYYFYSNYDKNITSFSLFPYYVLSEKRRLLISSDFSACTYVTNPEVIKEYCTEFQKILSSCVPLFIQSSSPKQALNIFSKSMEISQPRYIFESHPCMGLMAWEEDLLNSFYPLDSGIISSEIVVFLRTAAENGRYLFNSDISFKNYFTYEGLQKFIKTGLLTGPYSWNQRPVPLEKRKEILQHLLDTNLGSEKAVMLRKDFLPSTEIHMEVFTDNSLFLCCLTSEKSFFNLYLQEQGIGHAISDYLSSLEGSRFSYSFEESKKILNEFNIF